MENQETPLDNISVSMADITCQECGKISNFKQYHCIDITIHPEWKELLLNSSIFNWQCPHCGYCSDLEYPCRYIDGQAGLSIILNPQLTTDTGNQILQAMNERLERLNTSGFLHRAVDNFYAMQELVRIREIGLDDRVVQLLKPLIIGQMQSAGKVVWNGFFSHSQQENTDSQHGSIIYMIEDNHKEEAYSEPVLWFDICLTDNQIEQHGINLTAYYYCEQMLFQQEKENDDGYFHIYDLNWAIALHNRAQSE